MKVDLERYAEERLDKSALAERRLLLIDQLEYLIAEVNALAPLLENVATEVLTTAPLPDSVTAFEIFWAIAERDASIHLPYVEALATGAESVSVSTSVSSADASSVNEKTRSEVLERVKESRARLVEAVKAIPAEGWNRPVASEASLYAYLLAITQEDADRLRDVAYRLNESRLSDRT
jgi:hypothetical protein